MAYLGRYAWLFCCSVLLCMTGWSSAWASDSTSDEWTFTVAPYLWAVGMDGDVGLGRFKTSVNDSFIDIMQDSDSVMAFMGDFRRARGRGPSLSRRSGLNWAVMTNRSGRSRLISRKRSRSLGLA